MSVSASTETLIAELVTANHILANENVLDAFGHVSVRHPERPGHFLMSCSRAPELVRAPDILEYDERSQPVDTQGESLYIERFIHGEIYRARPDVHAVCHHHAAAIMPFCISGTPLVPVYQHGAFMGEQVPFWDSQDEFGDTNLLLSNTDHGASLARALGPHWCVLMRRHGATVVARNLTELVFRAVTSCANAHFQHQAQLQGHVDRLTPGEVSKASQIAPSAMARARNYWQSRLK
ncbi:MAG: class II aldolase/adducin family protein [Pigmentiphaga sp.]|uniref:class II aldolase/adducin family protein n=1 Tax=Pigmentiphaga sp. TaxID=1977564 RepID=UPI0029B5D3C7|nr:class II aldolase/adducin family protein [Pigmentiphaga sp.]MDX3908042.1 class II aldolase/adducin family protein [Pigmentiphaga sp.]